MAGLVPGIVVNSVDTVSFLEPVYEIVSLVGAYGPLFIFGLVVGAVGGGVSGVLQWFILWWNGYRVRWWVGASLGGWALGGAIATAIVGGAGVLLGGMSAGAITQSHTSQISVFTKDNRLMLRTSASNQKRDEGGSNPFDIDSELTHRYVTTEVLFVNLTTEVLFVNPPQGA